MPLPRAIRPRRAAPSISRTSRGVYAIGSEVRRPRLRPRGAVAALVVGVVGEAQRVHLLHAARATLGPGAGAAERVAPSVQAQRRPQERDRLADGRRLAEQHPVAAGPVVLGDRLVAGEVQLAVLGGRVVDGAHAAALLEPRGQPRLADVGLVPDGVVVGLALVALGHGGGEPGELAGLRLVGAGQLPALRRALRGEVGPRAGDRHQDLHVVGLGQRHQPVHGRPVVVAVVRIAGLEVRGLPAVRRRAVDLVVVDVGPQDVHAEVLQLGGGGVQVLAGLAQELTVVLEQRQLVRCRGSGGGGQQGRQRRQQRAGGQSEALVLDHVGTVDTLRPRELLSRYRLSGPLRPSSGSSAASCPPPPRGW